MKTSIYIFMAMMLFMATSVSLRGEVPAEAIAMERWDERYDWLEAPPEGVDSVMMPLLLYYWITDGIYGTAVGDFRVEAKKIPVAIKEDSIYLKMAIFKSWHRAVDSNGKDVSIHTFPNGWIKAVREGDSLRFPNKEIFAFSEYNAIIHNYFPARDTLYNQKDTFLINAVDMGHDSVVIQWIEGYPFNVRAWTTEYLSDPVTASYKPGSGTIFNPSADILISVHERPIVSNYDVHAEMAIRDFIIAPISSDDPDSLPCPHVSFYTGDWESWAYSYCNVSLDIMNEDGELWDYNKIHTEYYITGTSRDDGGGYGDFIEIRDGISGFNPFNNNDHYVYIGRYYNIEDLEVMCYYEKEDGTRIESPRIKAVDVTGVKDVMADRVVPNIVGDGKVYDLTGREVNPDRLSPGIYIRNGRKFNVTRQ